MSDISWLNPTPHAIAVFFNDPATTEIYTLSLPDALPILLGPDLHRLDRTSLRLAHVAVGTRVASRPPHRTVHAALPHTAPTSGPHGQQLPHASRRLGHASLALSPVHALPVRISLGSRP